MRSDVPAFALGGAPGEEREIRVSDAPGPILARRTPVPSRYPPSAIPPPAVAPSPAEAPTFYPSVVEGGNGGNSVETPGNQGEIAYPQDGNGQGNGEGRPTAPPGLAPRALPAPPDNPSRARIGPSPRYRASAPGSANPGSPLPTRSESLPTGLGPVETPLPWSQGRIPATYLVPGLPRTTSYRTPACQPGEGVTAVGVVGSGRGCPIKTQILGRGDPSAPVSPAQTRIAVC